MTSLRYVSITALPGARNSCALDWELPRRALHRQPAQLGKLIQRRAAAEPAAAAVLDAAERHLRLVVHRLIIDMHNPGLNALGDCQALIEVAGDDARGKAVPRVIRHANRLLDIIDDDVGATGPNVSSW